ncbi:MAG: hypothetical protein ACK4ND_03005 [Cytophagaceae bacterium]
MRKLVPFVIGVFLFLGNLEKSVCKENSITRVVVQDDDKKTKKEKRAEKKAAKRIKNEEKRAKKQYMKQRKKNIRKNSSRFGPSPYKKDYNI